MIDATVNVLKHAGLATTVDAARFAMVDTQGGLKSVVVLVEVTCTTAVTVVVPVAVRVLVTVLQKFREGYISLHLHRRTMCLYQ